MMSRMETHANGQGTELGKREMQTSRGLPAAQGGPREFFSLGKWETESGEGCSQEPHLRSQGRGSLVAFGDLHASLCFH